MGTNDSTAVADRTVDPRDPPERSTADWLNHRRGKTAALSRAWATMKLDHRGRDKPLPRKPNPVHATNPEQDWPDTHHAAKALGICIGELRNRIAHGRPVKGRVYSRTQPARHGVPTPVICLETRETWPSAAEAARQLGVSRPHICTAIRTGTRMHGRYYQWLQKPDTIHRCNTHTAPEPPSSSPPPRPSPAAPQ